MEIDFEKRYNELLSDFDNYKRNKESEIDQIKESAAKDTLIKLIPFFDDVTRLAQYHETGKPIYMKMILILREIGLEKMNVLGKKFNSDECEAVGTSHGHKVNKGYVSRIISDGYVLNGEVVKYAKVIVEQ